MRKTLAILFVGTLFCSQTITPDLSPAAAATQPAPKESGFAAQGTCATLDGNINITIPCIPLGDAQYQLVLNYYPNPAHPDALHWRLGDVTSSTDTGQCASVDASLTLTVPCLELAGARYRLSLPYDGSPDFSDGLVWTLGTIFVAPGESDVPWLREGNFWKVAWSEIETNTTWTEAGGTYDLGFYNIKLGSPISINGMQMHELLLSGDTRKYAPLWKRIGTDNNGNVYGMTGDNQSPVLIYSATGTTWSGSAFYTVFDTTKPVTVNRNAEIIPSQYTKDQTYFEGPLTAIGWSSSDQQIYSGTGCDYFPGYGTICGGGPSSGPSRNEMHYEYWDDEAGPVAMHYAYNYEDCLGFACNEKHVEQRVEVWFFGDTANSNFDFGYENEPDTYANPTPLPVSDTLFTMMAEVNNYDTPSGYIDGYFAVGGMDVAAQLHDWYAFEVTGENAHKTFDFYLFWNDPVELDFFLFTAPDNPVYGFMALAEGDAMTSFTELEHAKFFSGTYQPGKYLLGVRRTTDTEFATGYGIMSISGVLD